MPQLAESLVSATIDKWLKQPGDEVEVYEPICEILTDKVNAELPSTVAGKLVKILVGNGEKVDVGTPVCIIETAGSDEDVPQIVADTIQQSSSNHASGSPDGDSSADRSMRNRLSPAVQQLAAEHGVDLTQVPGSGLGGRITRKDILAYVESVKNRGLYQFPSL